MADRKYITWEEAVARGWYSRSWWKSQGVIIPADAEPKDWAWKPVQRTRYPIFSEDQGIRKPKKVKAEVVKDVVPTLFDGVQS